MPALRPVRRPAGNCYDAGRKGVLMKRIGICLFIAAAAGIAALNLYVIARGLATGGIATLHKSSNAIILRATDPGAFMINICLRALIALIFGAWSAMLLRDEIGGDRRRH